MSELHVQINVSNDFTYVFSIPMIIVLE